MIWSIVLASPVCMSVGRPDAEEPFPGGVVCGSVRLMAVVVSKHEDLQAVDLQPSDYQAWRQLWTQLR